MSSAMEKEADEHGTLFVCDTQNEVIDTSGLGSGLDPDAHSGACARLLSYFLTESDDEEAVFEGTYSNSGRWAGERVSVTTTLDGREAYDDITNEVRDEFDLFTPSFQE